MTSRAWVAPDAIVAETIDGLRAEMAGVLGQKLIGLYLYGSLVTGDFDSGLSDIDLLTVTASALTPDDIEALRAMHEAFAETHPAWNDRIEVVYLSAEDLRQFRTARPAFAVISPGEPFHLREEALADWTANWYLIREASLALAGPPAHQIIPEVSAREFREAVRRYIGELQQRVAAPRSSGSESYAILTACRALYGYATGLQASKRQAGRWMQTEHPQWSVLIDQALIWRYGQQERAREVQPETHALLAFVLQRLTADDGS